MVLHVNLHFWSTHADFLDSYLPLWPMFFFDNRFYVSFSLFFTGARGHVRVPYQTIDGTAKGHGDDYDTTEGYLDFPNDVTE